MTKAAAATAENAEPTEAVSAAQVVADEAGKTEQIAEEQLELQRQQARKSVQPLSTSGLNTSDSTGL